MHTPDQARELWCPMVRIARRESGSPEARPRELVAGCNTDALGGCRVPASCRCIADKCGMWRWGVVQALPLGAEPGKLYMAQDVRADTGYCGLAGRPGAAS